MVVGGIRGKAAFGTVCCLSFHVCFHLRLLLHFSLCNSIVLYSPLHDRKRFREGIENASCELGCK